MTIVQACQVLNVKPGINQAELKRIYLDAFKQLQLMLVPGQPVATRQKAQQQMAALKSAFDYLQDKVGPSAMPMGAKGATQSKGHSAGRCATHPCSPIPVFPSQGPTVPAFRWVRSAGFMLAVAVLLIVILMCVGSATRGEAYLRIQSVPWSDVKVNGMPLGPSGQAAPFVMKPGKCKLELSRGDKVLVQKIELKASLETIVKAQFDKGEINVVYQKHQ